jgi:predicted RNA-binding protein with PIN domain
MHWLVDGHNLIGHMPNLQLSDPNDEEKLLEYLRRYRARTGHRLTVIFDAGQSYRPAETKKQGGITVKFAPQGQTADRIIIRQVRQVRNPQGMIVVTSDRTIQQAVRQLGVRVVTAQEFSQQLFQLSGGAKPEKNEENQADLSLSPEDVEEWLKIFEARNHDPENSAH